MPRRSSRRRSHATNGIDSNTIHALPTIWPGRKSSEPKASHRNTIEFDDQSRHPRGDDGKNQPPAGERGVDRKVGELRQQECDRRSDDERGRRQQRG